MNLARKIELLAPARDLECGRTAILCGADAVYIGAHAFSARDAAGNSLDDIKNLIDFAHPFHVRVYVALNTLLYDHELTRAEKLIHDLYSAGIDGLIIQDMGLLQLDLPPVPMIASTQTHNHSLEQVRFLQSVGFSRAILARELTLSEITAIRAQTFIELECFIHGALCVCASGQCYMSYAIGGRSGNRGQCAQPCRKRYCIKDQAGRQLADWKYWLSLKDLNLSARITQLLQAGVTSFKIEGRLKGPDYVGNITAFYRRQLDAVLPQLQMQRASSGVSELRFQPDPARSFNRGFCQFGIDGLYDDWASPHTPKSIGQYLGQVKRTHSRSFELDTAVPLHNGDGLCFFDADNQLTGTRVNRIEADRIFPAAMVPLQPGMAVFRNRDHELESLFKKVPARRTIPVHLTFRQEPDQTILSGTDDLGICAQVTLPGPPQPARDPQSALKTIRTQLTKLGNTIFSCCDLTLQIDQPGFYPLSVLNQLKRDWTARMSAARIRALPRLQGRILKNNAPFHSSKLDFRGNVINQKSLEFYRRHGVTEIELGAESGTNLTGRTLMTSKYCLRRQLDHCPGHRPHPAPPLVLCDEQGRQFKVSFRCGPCGMEISRLPDSTPRPE